MNKWLQRALVSAGAAVVSTTAIVTTSQSESKRRKRKKGKKGKKRQKDESFEGRGADGAVIDDDVPRSVGAQAAHDFRVGHDGGLTAGEWANNVKGLGTKARDGASTLGTLLFGKGEPASDGEAPVAGGKSGKSGKRKKRRRRVRRKKGEAPPQPVGSKRKAARQGDEDVSDRLKDEAKRQATKAAANTLAEKVGISGAGMSDAVETLKEQGQQLWEKTEKLGATVRDKVPDDLGERVGGSLADAGRAIKDGANKLSDKVMSAVSDDDADSADGANASADDEAAATADSAEVGESDIAGKVGRGFSRFTRWVEGPGAPDYQPPDYEAAPEPTRVKSAANDDDDDDDEGEVVEPRDPDPPAG